MMFQSSLVGALAAAALVVAPHAVAAQSELASAEAAGFIGSWTLTLESPQGAFEQTLALKDVDGKVAGEISNQMQPVAVAITDIAKSGADLVLKFNGDFQGTAFTAKITLTPDGSDKAKVTFDVMDGQFVMEGIGTKNQ